MSEQPCRIIVRLSFSNTKKTILRNLIFYFLAALLAITFSSCQDDSDKNTEPYYIIFGHFYGMCQGEQCVEIFKVTDKAIFEDSKDNYPNSDDFVKTDFSKLCEEQFQKAQSIISSFPIGILNEPDTVMGCPDCHDQGGLYIEYRKENIRDFWIIDNDKSAVDENFHDFIDEAHRVITEINKL